MWHCSVPGTDEAVVAWSLVYRAIGSHGITALATIIVSELCDASVQLIRFLSPTVRVVQRSSYELCQWLRENLPACCSYLLL